MFLVRIAPVIPFSNQSGLRGALWEVRFNKQLGEGYDHVQMRFATQEQAVHFVKRKGWSYELEPYEDGKKKTKIVRRYPDNFKASRKVPWTH